MLEYEWGNPSTIMISGDESMQDSEQNRQFFDPYTTPNFSETTGFVHAETHFGAAAAAHHLQYHHPQVQNTNTHINHFYDTRVCGGLSSSYQAAPPSSMLSLEPFCPTGFVVVPKSEPMVGGLEFNPELSVNASRIGLNLGGRTYFASSEDDFVNRLYRRSRILEPGPANSPRCQAEGCNADLSHAKHYHRRHKVCEFHSKAATVVAAGLTQRFCQQCSRFHLLSEFDNGKRSCRKRLADHNRRRRKSQQNNQETGSSNKSQLENSGPNSSNSEYLAARSPPDSEPHSSSVTVAISPPRISLDCLGQRYYRNGTGTASSPTASTRSLYFSNPS
ncbi:squamosa promoter-binding-like protein 8 [Primulina tabacum]|uniref:squamosa promoter-binding-like protein 8 n=1 Tax=Primulina tabacum TaxID=48773 RepID=UPI003F5AA4EB